MTVNVPIRYRHIMSARRVLDFRAGAPWSPHARAVFARAADAAWGDPAHPSSEGRRSAIWLQAAAATVRDLTGFPHVAFLPHRDLAPEVLRAAGITLAAAPATHRRRVLAHVAHTLPVQEDGQRRGNGPEGWLALQAANEETGVIDLDPGQHRVVLDATASFGRSPLPFDADLVLADARAWGSPVDCALVLSRHDLGLVPRVQVPAVAVAVDALAAALGTMSGRAAAESAGMHAFEQRVLEALPDVQFHGADRVAHIRSLSVLHLDAETLMTALDARGWVLGSGSACVQDGTPSHVLAAMGRVTHGNLRIALPIDCDLAALPEFADDLVATVRQLRIEAGVDDL